MKPPKVMTALCIAQPWVYCIFKKGKNVENRDQNLKKRGTIAVYASATPKQRRFDSCAKNYKIRVSPDDVPLGMVVGFVEIVDVIQKRQVTSKTRRWFVGDYGYVLAKPIILKKPVPVKPPKGAVKFWDLKGKALKQCLKRLSGRQRARLKPFV